MYIYVKNGFIVWVNSGFCCRSNPDLKIFQIRMKNYLLQNETVITDDGYTDPKCVQISSVPKDSRKAHYEIRAKHENVNRRLKQFLVLEKRFRHDIWFHTVCFHAVAKISQLCMENKELE